MPSATYCKAILQGLKAHGLSHAEILRIGGFSDNDVVQILAETRSFSDEVLVCIEKETGMTGGQLAILSADDVPDSLKSLFDEWAETRQVLSTSDAVRTAPNRLLRQ